jgi:ribonuclease P protein component
MLKKSARLGRAAFSNYFSKGKRSHGLYTTVIYSPAEAFLCSVVVGKKVSKKAPVRNTIRRRIYSLVERIVKEKNLSGAYIVIVKPEVIKLSKKAFGVALEEEVGRVLN